MKTYQTLSLIGCIIGIFLMLFLSAIAGLGTISNDVSLNLTKQYGNPSELANKQKAHTASEELFSSFGAGTAFSLFLFMDGMMLISRIGYRDMSIIFTGDPESFDKQMPAVQKMIDSIKITGIR